MLRRPDEMQHVAPSPVAADAAEEYWGGAPRVVRVLHVITSLDRGGAENHLLALIANADRRQFEMEVAVLCGEGELVDAFRAAGIPVHLIGSRWRVDPAALARLTALVRGGDYDIVHSHLFRADIYGSLAARGVSRRPRIVSTRHNDDRFFLNPFVGLVHYAVSAQQDMIIAISDHVARFTIARGVRDPARVRRVYHGLDPPASSTLDREGVRIRAALGVATSDFLVGNVGRLAPQKGQRHLIGAMPLLLERVGNAHLAIVGGGDLEPYLRDLAREVGVSERVHVLGPRRDVPAFMHAIDVFAMPSIWEGFGIVLLEAMAAARPIVASRVATIPEVVEDGDTGVLVPPGDAPALAEALAWLAAEPEQARRLGMAGEERLRRRFSLQKMVADTEALYRELVA
jgi:glycosyltransferase involved in cell wall biosynthesis